MIKYKGEMDPGGSSENGTRDDINDIKMSVLAN